MLKDPTEVTFDLLTPKEFKEYERKYEEVLGVT